MEVVRSFRPEEGFVKAAPSLTKMSESSERPVSDEGWRDLFIDQETLDEEGYRREFPPAWHGGASQAEMLLAPSVSAVKFCRADRPAREAAVDLLLTTQSRGLLFRAAFYLILVSGFLIILKGIWLSVCIGAVAIKAGRDVAVHVQRSRFLKLAVDFDERALELEEPEPTGESDPS